MPEGPSILILKEALQPFEGKKVLEVGGNRKIDIQRLKNKNVTAIRTYGKELLITFGKLTVRIHMLLFGTYRINERKETIPRLSLRFKNDEVNFYGCSVKFLETEPDEMYDWSSDVLSERWSKSKAIKKLKSLPAESVCDVLLDQKIFAGVGNIIKNEVLYRIKVHPESNVGGLTSYKLNKLVDEARNYSFDFLRWKKNYVLKKNWLIHTKRICKRCNLPVIKKYIGKTQRRTFYCDNCQVKYFKKPASKKKA